MTTIPSSETLLEPLLVVEIGSRIGVGACGGLLAQLGATVVVVEPAQAMHSGKWRNRAAALAGKESIVIDPASPADTMLLQDLLARADVLLLSTDDGFSDIGLWHAPRGLTQIVCDVTAFGHDGPLANRGGSEAIVGALTGVVDTTGDENGPPAVIGAPVLEMTAAVFAAAAIAAALRVRRLHRFGQRIDIAVFDTAINELSNFLPLLFDGQHATRSGNRHPLHVPWGSYIVRDGHILICAATQQQFSQICTAIGMPELAMDERFASTTSRLRHFREIDRHIEAWARELTAAQCEAALTAAGVACGPIVNVLQLQDEPNLAHRESILMLRDPDSACAVPIAASPVRGAPTGGRAPASIPARDSGRDRVAALIQARRSGDLAPQVLGDTPSDVRPLAGVRVVEIGHYTVAPFASRQLGALGADVIKIESPSGDAVRQAAPLRSDGLSYIFAISNTDKRGLVLDLRDDSHREMLHQLLDQADILIENLRPGALDKRGFGSDALRKRHPKLAYCSLTGFGNDSVYPGRRALDTVIQAMSGLMSLTQVDAAPMKTGVSASDMLGGGFGLLASLAALEYRDRTGIAAHFDLSMQDASTWMTQFSWHGSLPAESVSVREAADGYVVAAASATHIADAIGAGPWPGDRNSLQATLAAAGIDSAPVLTLDEVVDSTHVAARRLLIERPTSEGDVWTVIGSPLGLRATPAVVRKTMSRLGAEDSIIIKEFALCDSPSGASSAPQLREAP